MGYTAPEQAVVQAPIDLPQSTSNSGFFRDKGRLIKVIQSMTFILAIEIFTSVRVVLLIFTILPVEPSPAHTAPREAFS